jgi:hypothetical protein
MTKTDRVAEVFHHIGLSLAHKLYGLALLPASDPHEATAPDGRLVQVRAARGLHDDLQIRLHFAPEWLLVLAHGENDVAEVYNGPGGPAWDAAEPMQQEEHRAISLARLRDLMPEVPGSDRLPRQEATEYEPPEIAHHEAGHAVIASVLGIRITHGTIERDEGSLGHVQQDRTELDRILEEDPDFYESESKRWAVWNVVNGFAGELAERRFVGRDVKPSQHDMALCSSSCYTFPTRTRASICTSWPIASCETTGRGSRPWPMPCSTATR